MPRLIQKQNSKMCVCVCVCVCARERNKQREKKEGRERMKECRRALKNAKRSVSIDVAEIKQQIRDFNFISQI